MTAHAASAGALHPRVEAARGPVVGLALARGSAYLALVAFGALHWMAMLEPTATARAWSALGIGALVALGLLGAGRLHGGRGQIAAALVGAVALALALLAGGVADELLRPDRWSELSSAIGRGIAALPGARVPYRGLDEWTRTVIALGGTVLVVAAGLLAFWPRRGRPGFPLAALVALIALYAVPMVALDFAREFLRGALLALLVLAFLRLERLSRAELPAAGALAAVALVLGLLVAPALDASEPWFDYETWALETAGSKSATFSWDHSYGPLHWPRDGRELLRIKARQQAYWKAQNLDIFDGRAWVSGAPGGVPPPSDQLGSLPGARRWRQRIEVNVRNLRSTTFVTAGFPVDAPQGLKGVAATPTGVPGIRAASRVLRRGDTYTETVYTPNPSGRLLAGAGEDYALWLDAFRRLLVQDGRGPLTYNPRTHLREPGPLAVEFPAWGSGNRAFGERLGAPGRGVEPDVRPALRRGGLWRSWQLVGRLKAQAPSPYQFVLAVEEYLGSSAFAYSESPPAAARTLDGFLFDARVGYCQQFSGAEALLLRMAGIPARVATGFTSGAYDAKAGQWVVRDLDAHSWVEVWFPGFGWVTRDPTPAAAPPRRPGALFESRTGELAPGSAPQLAGGRAGDTREDAAAVAGDGVPWLRVLVLAALALVAAVALWRIVRRRGPADRTPLEDLRRALRRAGLEAGPAITLAALEARFRTPAAAAYVRTLREQRYGRRAVAPTGAQRRGLRHELARGGGPRGWLRAWWALPPRRRP